MFVFRLTGVFETRLNTIRQLEASEAQLLSEARTNATEARGALRAAVQHCEEAERGLCALLVSSGLFISLHLILV